MKTQVLIEGYRVTKYAQKQFLKSISYLSHMKNGK